MILPGRGGLTGGTVIPSGNPLGVLRRAHHSVKRRVITFSLREGKSWQIKPGQRMLFSLGRRIVYERETRTRKPTPKPDALSQWRTMEVQRKHVSWMEIFKSKRDGVLKWSPAGLVECRVLCLKRTHPKRLLVTPSRCEEPDFGNGG